MTANVRPEFREVTLQEALELSGLGQPIGDGSKAAQPKIETPVEQRRN